MVGKCTYQIYEVERMKKVNNEKHESRNKNILIGALLAVILIMGVGYAAFAQQLTINGTASISSTWQVELTDIESTGHTGTGVDVPYAAGTAEDGTKLVNSTTAQFKADLKSPGDSVTYTVTVENKGNIDAEVGSITFTEGNEAAPISYSYTGINEGDPLNASGNTTFTVTVTYDSSITEQPEITDNTVTMTINYVQAGA